MRAKAFLSLLVLSSLLLACAPRPPSWVPFPEELTQSARWYVDVERFQRSAHGTLTCDECHANIMPDSLTDPHPDTDKLVLSATELYDYADCESCHPQEYAAYQQGQHAAAMANPEEVELDQPAPTCGHCHDAHYATAESRSELLASVSETCAGCHQPELETYEENYHGKAALLGYEQTATCTDCHGAHTVLALQETDEAISACRLCHPEANDQFVSFRIHPEETLNPDPDDPRALESKIFFWVKLFFSFLVVGVLAFFYAHTGLWFLRSLHERLRRDRHHG